MSKDQVGDKFLKPDNEQEICIVDQVSNKITFF